LEITLALPLKSDFEFVRKNKVYEEVARQIERLILKKLKPGDKTALGTRTCGDAASQPQLQFATQFAVLN